MATKAVKPVKKPRHNFKDAEVDYRIGSMSVNAIAIKHGIPEPSLRMEAKKQGWIKGLASSKRAMVKDAMSGADLTNSLTNDEVRKNQLTEAQQDVADMNSGLSVARGCITALMLMVPSVDKPRDIKTIVEANKSAIETIRKIRGLDDAPTSTEDGITSLIASINGTSLPITK
jgi:hypothetical protein